MSDVTPDEFRRLHALELRAGISEERDRVADENMRRMEDKLDQLLTAAAMGKGIWWFTTRVGGVAVVGLTALYWAADHFHWWQK